MEPTPAARSDGVDGCALRAGDSVVLITSSELALDWLWAAVEVVQELGLVPLFYHGLVGGLDDGVYLEAANDLARSRAVIAIVASHGQKAAGEFILGYLSHTHERSVPALLFLAPTSEKAARNFKDLPDSIVPETVSSIDDLRAAVRRSLLALMSK